MRRLYTVAVVVATLSHSFISGVEPAPCSTGTIAMEVSSTAELRSMINTINCTGEGTFNVTWTASLQLGQTIALSDKKNLTITGSGAVPVIPHDAVIDGGNTSGIFSVSGSSTLRLKGLVLKGGSSKDGGSVDVRSSSSAYVFGCYFTGNNASTGGAISVHDSEIHIDGDTMFTQNTAQEFGGVIYANQSEIHVGGQTTFANNSAGDHGGVIYAEDSICFVDGFTSFANNSGGLSGGVIYAKDTRIYVTGSTSFSDNSAGESGDSGVHARVMWKSFRDTLISFVSGGPGNTEIWRTGDDDELVAWPISIRSNGVPRYRTGGYWRASATNTLGEILGAIFAQNTDVRIDGNTSFENNSADEDAGAIYAEHGKLHATGDTYLGHNSANHSGGAIYVFNCSAYFDGNTDLSHNSAAIHGGAMRTEEGSDVHFDGQALFGNNSAGTYGGALRVDDSELFFDGRHSFADNMAGRSGAVLSARTSGVYIAGETAFTDNAAKFDGGVMFIYGSSQVNITGNVTCHQNSAVNSGGALCSYQGSTLKIFGTTSFVENVANWRGGGFYASGSTYSIDGTTSFSGNKAYDGGAFVARESEVHIDGNTRFSLNSASHDGGAINMLGSTFISMGEVEISSNTALNGGGIFAFVCPTFQVLGTSSFFGNSAVLVGGAISLTDSAQVHITRSAFVSNQAGSGGAVSMTSTAGTTGGFEGCQFYSNNASNGGALHLTFEYTVESVKTHFVRDSVFRRNVAYESGGALFNIGPLEINNTMFKENTAAGGGLAVMNEQAPLDLWNVSFDGNMLSCDPDEYLDFDHGPNGGCRFELVCDKCLEACKLDPSFATIASERVPSCEAIPLGVSTLSTTTLATFDLLPGFYRISADSRDIMECFRYESCLGGANALNYCNTGYTGPYCAVCEDGYTPGVLHRCHKCSTLNRRLAIGLATFVLILLSLIAVWLVPRPRHGGETGARVRVRHAISSGYKLIAKAFPLSTIKIVVVVLQIISQFTEIAGAVFPDEYEAFLSKTIPDTLDIGVILQNFCVVTTDFYDRLLISTLGPLVVLSALSSFYYIAEKNKRRQTTAAISDPTVQPKHLSIGLFVIFFVYSSVSFTIFQTFVCEDLDDGNAYLRADYSITCWTKTHDKYRTYAGVMVFVYPVGIPAFYGWWLARNRQDLSTSGRQEVAHLQSFRGLWTAYKPSCYYYEVVECSRRVVLTGAAVFILPNSSDQIAVVLILAVVFMFVSESLSPFEVKHDMWLYRWGNGIVLGSMYVALLIKIELAGEESGISMAMTAMLIAANAFMLVAVVVPAAILLKRMYISRRLG